MLAADAGPIGNLELIFPTLFVARNLDEVAQTDYDVLITRTGVPEGTSDDLFVLALDRMTADDGDLPLGEATSREYGRAWATYGPGSLTREFVRPDLPSDLAKLVEDVLQPAVELARSHRVVKFHIVRGPYLTPVSAKVISCVPFLVGNDGSIIACSFRRSSYAECWALPAFVTDLVPWAQAAVRQWRDFAPERFPGEANWRQHERWATTAERDLLSELAIAAAEIEAQTRDFNERHRRTLERLIELRVLGDRTHRAILTEQSEALVQGVLSALERLGFKVELVDNSGRSAKVEDLRITDPEMRDWIALGEVKGYARGGARSSDLQQIGKFQALFAAEHGRLPDRSWYLVNHSLNEDPNLRREALQGAEPEIQVFADTGGLVIDTRALFDISVDVEASVLSGADARSRLRSETGRFRYNRLS